MNKACKNIVVTGAHSPLVKKFLSLMAGRTDVHLHCLVTPWSTPTSYENIESPQNITFIRADLTQPLPPAIGDVIRRAHTLLHLAWKRGAHLNSVRSANEIMIRNLMSLLDEPSRFYFVSSVAASPTAESIYGRTKFETANLVLSLGGSVFVVGLATDEPPVGAYKMLINMVKKSPFSLRTRGNCVSVYPISTAKIVNCFSNITREQLQPGIYRVFDEPVDLNLFLKSLEERWPKRRIPLRYNPQQILTLTKTLLTFHLCPKRIADKVLTFLQKNDEYLCGPNIHLRIHNKGESNEKNTCNM